MKKIGSAIWRVVRFFFKWGVIAMIFGLTGYAVAKGKAEYVIPAIPTNDEVLEQLVVKETERIKNDPYTKVIIERMLRKTALETLSQKISMEVEVIETEEERDALANQPAHEAGNNTTAKSPR